MPRYHDESQRPAGPTSRSPNAPNGRVSPNGSKSCSRPDVPHTSSAPERMAGTKLLTLRTPHGKLTPELCAPRIERMDDIHAVRPGMVSVTNSTELGTVYTVDELRALADFAHGHGLLLHVDGARLANA